MGMGDSQRDGGGAGATRCRAGRAIALLGLAGMIFVCGSGWACGGRAPAAKSPEPDPAADASQGAAGPGEPAPVRTPAEGPAGPDTNVDPGGAAPANPVTEAECQALLAHVVAVANAAHAQTVAPEHAPTAEQLAEIRARMAPEFLPLCLSLDRAALDCQMRAQTRDALLACQP
jgi:hypothetical protein